MSWERHEALPPHGSRSLTHDYPFAIVCRSQWTGRWSVLRNIADETDDLAAWCAGFDLPVPSEEDQAWCRNG